jgi:hypothetical protein
MLEPDSLALRSLGIEIGLESQWQVQLMRRG